LAYTTTEPQCLQVETVGYTKHGQKQQVTQQKHPFNGPLSRTTQVSQFQKGKINLDLLEQQIVNGSVISWTICKSAPRPRQLTMPAPTTQFFTGQMSFLLPNQQCQRTGSKEKGGLKSIYFMHVLYEWPGPCQIY